MHFLHVIKYDVKTNELYGFITFKKKKVFVVSAVFDGTEIILKKQRFLFSSFSAA